MKLARALYYRRVRQPVGPAEKPRSERVSALREAHSDDLELGYRLLLDEAHQISFPLADRTEQRLYSHPGSMSVIGKTRRRNGGKPGPPVSDKLGMRNFTAISLNELWLTDITEPQTWEGKLYLRAVKEAFS